MAKIIDKNIIDANSASYRIDFGDDMILWFDVWINEDNEIAGDWNKYIFFTDNEDDVKEKAFQEANNEDVGAYNFMTALELCEDQFLTDFNLK